MLIPLYTASDAAIYLQGPILAIRIIYKAVKIFYSEGCRVNWRKKEISSQAFLRTEMKSLI